MCFYTDFNHFLDSAYAMNVCKYYWLNIPLIWTVWGLPTWLNLTQMFFKIKLLYRGLMKCNYKQWARPHLHVYIHISELVVEFESKHLSVILVKTWIVWRTVAHRFTKIWWCVSKINQIMVPICSKYIGNLLCRNKFYVHVLGFPLFRILEHV